MFLEKVKDSIKKIVPHRYWKSLSKVSKKFVCKRKSKYRKVIKEYQYKNKRENFAYQKKYEWLIDESKQNAGSVKQYYWQDLWAAQKVIERAPEVHYDIGSRLDGFIAHLQAARQQTVMLDIRPLKNKLPYLDFIQEDATMLSGIQDESIDSLSSLCALEHFGLGRYGDSIDPEACFKAMKSIQRVMKPGGRVYISVPIGKEHVEFNAQRVFYAETVVNELSEMELIEFSVNTLEKERMTIVKVCDIHEFDEEDDNHGGRFGLFEFVKK